MLRKWASLVFGLALVIALGIAMAQACPAQPRGGSSGFSSPCEPAAPAFQAASATIAVSTLDSTYALESVPGAVCLAGRRDAVAAERAAVPAAPRTFPPLFRRPPPPHS